MAMVAGAGSATAKPYVGHAAILKNTGQLCKEHRARVASMHDEAMKDDIIIPSLASACIRLRH